MVAPGTLVWGPNAFRKDKLWPGVVLPQEQVPDFVKRIQASNRLCICFYGPSIAETRSRDYCWVPEEALVLWGEHSPPEQAALRSDAIHNDAFKLAHEEALSVDAGYLDPFQGSGAKVDPSTPCCFSCGKPMKAKEVAAAKEQQDRCFDCQQLFLNGQHCQVCQRVWFPYEAEDLVACKRCGGKVHAACDPKAARAKAGAIAQAHGSSAAMVSSITLQAIKQEEQPDSSKQLVPANSSAVSGGYTCPVCCQKEADESRMDLLHLHQVVLADMKPRKPRTAAEVFAAAYARKYVSNGGKLDFEQLQGLISSAWQAEEDKAKYEQQAREEAAAFKAAAPQYESLFNHYLFLAASMRREVDVSLALDTARLLGMAPSSMGRGPGSSSGFLPAIKAEADMRGSSRGQPGLPALPPPASSAAAAPVVHVVPRQRTPGSVLGSGEVIKAEDGSEVPQQIPIVCNGMKGTFLLADMKVVCSCTSCAVQPIEKRTFTPTQYEQHSGAGSAKKWKASLRIEPGAVRECPLGSNPMAFGKWMDMKGIEAKGSKSSTVSHQAAVEAVKAMLSGGPAASVKREPRIDHSERQHHQSSFAGTSDNSPASSSRGADGAAAGGGISAGGAAVSSEKERPAGPAGMPRNRRPDSWHPWDDVNLGNFKAIEVKWAGDRCCVCDSDVDYDCDRLVSCDQCGITVHQSCYGIPELPDMDDMWLCRSCELKEPGAPEPQCCLCPLVGGGLKPTTLPGLWCHAACMQWIPEVTCSDPSRMEPIDRIQNIQKERWELLCCICRQRMGAKIQCNDCYQAYHPLCARRVGLHMEMAEPLEPDGPLQIITYCPKHCKPQPHLSGVTLLREEDAVKIGRPRKRKLSGGGYEIVTDDDGPDFEDNGLWNCQPFKANRPLAPLPAPLGSCARSSTFTAKRIQHGTGTGCTSTAGFWIPTADTAAATGSRGVAGSGLGAVADGSAVAGALGAQGSAAGCKGVGRKKRKFGRGGGSSSSGAGRGGVASARLKAQKLLKGGAPPPAAELMPLPDGLPETVTVVCNGKSGSFIIRAQRVLVGDQEHTASRFEAMCGKGDAKKWKSSLWATTADGQPDCCMGDWLASRHVDRNVLAKLAANLAAAEAYRVWQEQQQQQTGEEGDNDAETEAGDEDNGDEETENADDGAAESTGGPTDGSMGEAATGTGGNTASTAEGVGNAAAAAAEEAGVEVGTRSAPTAGTQPPQANGSAEQHQQGNEKAKAAGGKRRSSIGGDGMSPAASADGPAAKKLKLSLKVGTPQGQANNKQQQGEDNQQQHQDNKQEQGAEEAAAAVTAVAVKGQEQQQSVAVGTQKGQAEATAAMAAAANTAADHHAIAEQAAANKAAAAAALRREHGLVLLQKVRYDQLPEGYRVHPASLPPPAAVAAVERQQQSLAAGDNAAGGSSRGKSAGPAGAEASAATAADEADEEKSAAKDPWGVIGHCCRMYWPDDDEWYEADVTGYNSNTGQHSLYYHPDDMREEIDLVDEEKHGRVQWLPMVDRAKWPPVSRQKGQQQQQHHAAAPNAVDVDIAQAAVQYEPMPPGFPRLTSMHRDPTDGSVVDLVALVNMGTPLQQQLQHMLVQQQEQHRRFSRAQPLPHQVPTGQAAVGWRVGVFWPQAGVYYYGLLTAFHDVSHCHTVQYDDGQGQWINTQQERLDWVKANGQQASQAAYAIHQQYTQCRETLRRQQQQPGQSQQQIQLQVQQVYQEAQQLGWQQGQLMPPRLQQRLQQLNAVHNQQQQLPQPMQQQYQQSRSAAPPAAAPVGSASAPNAGAPTHIDIVCGTATGVFDCKRMAVLTDSGNYVSPTEFERMAGKGSSKKWKCTLRIRKANGTPGITMGDWLLQMGYDQPKPPAGTAGPDGGRKASLNDIRRQQTSRKAAVAAGAVVAAAGASASAVAASSGKAGDKDAAAAAGPPGVRPAAGGAGGHTIVTARGVALHREGCMCVICKQARRKAAQEAGLAPAPEDAYVPRQPGEGGGKAAGSSRASGYTPTAPRSSSLDRDLATANSRAAAGDNASAKKFKIPPVMIGKRAYVQAVPHLVRGSAVHRLWQIPHSRSYTPEEWELKQRAEVGLAAGGSSDAVAAAAGVSMGGTPSLSGSRPPTPVAPREASPAAANAAAAGGDTAMVDVDSSQPLQLDDDDKQPSSHEQQQQQQPQKRGSRTQTWREKLRVCRSLENQRITFGKSGIHGWGIFARVPIKQDSMVTDFRGQLVRCILADVREAKYRKQARDCYMFHAADETVIDNTGCGNYSRFTNHCCAPCLYAKPLELGGELHLCFFARTDIKQGQELTFDYRFKEEDSDSKVICQCGAPTCKGTLN